MNTLYMINSIVTLVLYIISWCKPGLNYITFIAFELTTLRLIVKILDNENEAEN